MEVRVHILCDFSLLKCTETCSHQNMWSVLERVPVLLRRVGVLLLLEGVSHGYLISSLDMFLTVLISLLVFYLKVTSIMGRGVLKFPVAAVAIVCFSQFCHFFASGVWGSVVRPAYTQNCSVFFKEWPSYHFISFCISNYSFAPVSTLSDTSAANPALLETQFAHGLGFSILFLAICLRVVLKRDCRTEHITASGYLIRFANLCLFAEEVGSSYI